MHRKLEVSIFIVALLLEMVGFLVANAGNLPFVLKIVSADYVNANNGLNILEKEQVLKRGEQGFVQLSNLFLSEAQKENPLNVLKNIDVINFEIHNSGVAFSRGAGAQNMIPITVVLSNNQNVSWEMNLMRDKVNGLKSKHLFQFACILFIVGLLIHTLQFFTGKTRKMQTK